MGRPRRGAAAGEGKALAGPPQPFPRGAPADPAAPPEARGAAEVGGRGSCQELRWRRGGWGDGTGGGGRGGEEKGGPHCEKNDV